MYQRQWGPQIFKKNALTLLVSLKINLLAIFWPFGLFLTGPLKSSFSLIGSMGYPDMWGVQNNLTHSHNHETSVSRLPLLWKSPFLPFWPFLDRFWHSWRLLWNPHCLWLVSSGPWGTLTCEESRTHWVRQNTLKKMRQDCPLLWKSPFLPCWPFPAAFDFHYGFFEAFIVSDLLNKLPIHVTSLENLSLYHNLEKECPDCWLFWKSFIWLFWAVLDDPDGSLAVLFVSDWFYKVPWHVRMPEYCESLPVLKNKCVKTATLVFCLVFH